MRTSTPAAPLTSALERRRQLRFVVTAGAIAAGLYAIFYVDHGPASRMTAALSAYLDFLAWLTGSVLGAVDATVAVQGHTITGRFPLEIVLDCAALDVQSLFVAAVIAFPAAWSRRLAGVGAGLVVLFVVNLVRIVSLYFIGSYWPTWFHAMHEEVFQLLVVLAACALFVLWILWARNTGTPSRGSPGTVHAVA